MGSAAPNVTVSVDALLSVTTDVPDVPLETTEHDCTDGNVYMFAAATVTAAVVRVLTNVQVNVVSTALAVTDAPRTLLADSVAPKFTVAVVASVSSALVVEPDANAPKFPSIVEFELPNVNCVLVARAAPSLYVSPPAIVPTLTGSGTP